MKPAAFDYIAPATLPAALDALATTPDARVLAGGQSLTPMLNLRLAMPSLLVDLGGIAELRRVEQRSERHIIGAMVTHAAIEDGAHSFADRGMLAAVAAGVAYRAVRTRGTIGGSLAHADPAADWPSALLALDAAVVMRQPTGTREIALADFLVGAFTTALSPGEVLTAIAVPRLSEAARWGYYKICRKAGEFPDAIGAVVLDPARGVRRIVMGALDGPPLVLTALGEDASANDITAAVAAVAPELDPVDHRLHVVAVQRALAQARTA